MAVSTERPGARWWMPERPSLTNLRSAIEACRGCELYADATHGVCGDGDADAKLMLLGEQPGSSEDEAGRPFVGPAGKLLDKALAEAGVDAASVFTTNVVKHFRFSGTRGKQRIHKTPGRVHVAACEPWLLAEIDLVRPRGLILLGGTAGQAIYGPTFRVGDTRGQVRPWPAGRSRDPRHPPEWTVATAHPSSVLRSRSREEDFARLVADLTAAADQLTAHPR